jgi:hypothetical protein
VGIVGFLMEFDRKFLFHTTRKELEKIASRIMADSGYDRYWYVPTRVSSMSRAELIEYIDA